DLIPLRPYLGVLHELVKILKELAPEAPLQVSECFNLEEKIIINPKYPEKTETIGRKLPIKAKQRLNKLLKDNADMFAWQYTDMTGIPRTLNIRGEIFATEYKLNEDKKITLIQQNKRKMTPDRIAAASKEVEELKKVGILKETRYQTWVANTVMVKKTDGAWRMCVDFTDINKACPKDCYSLPEIDWKVDLLFDFKLKCFLDAYKGATYQRLVDKVFERQIRRNLEAYVDDMVIKSMDETYMIADIQETFERLRKINMKLNPKKCSFGMLEGQFLGHVVSKQGIKPT
ncbi:reverse transcriptase domain-containing protein, partial [Tanacetum coccineum]